MLIAGLVATTRRGVIKLRRQPARKLAIYKGPDRTTLFLAGVVMTYDLGRHATPLGGKLH
jgi:hypothetical protein